MKKLLAVLMVLSIATVANAALVITGVPTGPINASDTVTIGLSSDGENLDPTGAINSEGVYLIPNGPGSFDISNAVNTVTGSILDADWTEAVGDVFIDLSLSGVPIPPIPAGDVVSGIVFHCDGPGDVVLTVVGDATGVTHATATINQIPEPITLGLLGIGGLFLRRRK
jgi:hypothetical protein